MVTNIHKTFLLFKLQNKFPTFLIDYNLSGLLVL